MAVEPALPSRWHARGGYHVRCAVPRAQRRPWHRPPVSNPTTLLLFTPLPRAPFNLARPDPNKPLDCPLNDARLDASPRLLPTHLGAAPPPYVVLGGLVLTRASVPFLASAFGPQWVRLAPVKLLDLLSEFPRVLQAAVAGHRLVRNRRRFHAAPPVRTSLHMLAPAESVSSMDNLRPAAQYRRDHCALAGTPARGAAPALTSYPLLWVASHVCVHDPCHHPCRLCPPSTRRIQTCPPCAYGATWAADQLQKRW
eukprot:359163-Chlamydomonas_euryale.AAC.2